MFKRLTIIVAVILFLSPVTAFAGYGVHKMIKQNSDSCTGCHRQHAPISTQGVGVETSLAGAALAAEETSEYEFCITCHGPDATGADTNISLGVYNNADSSYGTDGAALNGGGFTKVGGLNGKDVTSTHAMDGGTYTILGSSGSSSIQMVCSTCHDPSGSTNYRLLRDSINGRNVANFVQSNETGFKSETPSMPKTPKTFDTYVPNFTTPMYKTATDPAKGMSGWCAACHDQYLSGGNSYIDANGRRRFHHAVNAAMSSNPDKKSSTLPLDKASAGTAQTDPNNQVDCLSCHVAHGTASVMSANARVEPTKSFPSSGPGFSALLRLDNRGVCQDCHNK